MRFAPRTTTLSIVQNGERKPITDADVALARAGERQASRIREVEQVHDQFLRDALVRSACPDLVDAFAAVERTLAVVALDDQPLVRSATDEGADGGSAVEDVAEATACVALLIQIEGVDEQVVVGRRWASRASAAVSCRRRTAPCPRSPRSSARPAGAPASCGDAATAGRPATATCRRGRGVRIPRPSGTRCRFGGTRGARRAGCSSRSSG